MSVLIRAAARCSLVVLLAGAASGCGAATPAAPGEVAPVDGGRLEVNNRSSLDMDLFLVGHSGIRSRLGLAPGGKVTTFALTPAQVAGANPVVFQAVPTLRGGQAISSDPVNVTSKEAVTLDIPPQ